MLKSRFVSLMGMILFAMSACKSDTAGIELVPFESAYWELKNNYPAILISHTDPVQTLQLEAVPYTPTGTPIPLESAENVDARIIWSSSDSSKVHVTQTGIISALEETDGAEITASLTIGKITHSAVSRVVVRNSSLYQEIATFSITPTDSLKRARGSFVPYTFPAKALDYDGNTMQDLPIHWETSNKKFASVAESPDIGIFWVITGDSVFIKANSWVYGIFVRDSFNLKIGEFVFFPLPASEVKQTVTNNGNVIFVESSRRSLIGSGGGVVFKNTSGFGPTNRPGVPPIEGKQIDIIFDDPSVALAGGTYMGDVSGESGNILGLSSDTTQHFTLGQAARRFIKLGEHAYTIQPFGYRGVVIVRP